MGKKSNIMWSGSVFSPTGFGKHSREMVLALEPYANVEVDDFFVPRQDINANKLKKFCYPILDSLEDINQTFTVINDYPRRWDKGHGFRSAFLIHEGSKLPPQYAQAAKKVDLVLAPSKATKRLGKWNGISNIRIVPEGVDPDFYYPVKKKKDKFKFLFVGSWTGLEIDRKGAGSLIKAFHEEFKNEDVELYLKLSTFWMAPFDVQKRIRKIIGEKNNKIKFDQTPRTPEQIRSLYWNCDAFVMPTSGEAFGLTIIEAMASGIPVIVTRDKNSGYMDYTKDYVTYTDWKELREGNHAFFCEGNMFPKIDVEDLKKKMREVYENYEKKRKLAKKASDFVRKEFNWDKAAKKLIKVLEEKNA